MIRLAVLLAATATLGAGATGDPPTYPDSDAPVEFHRYIVLGGGPGGLQVGHYLHSAARDYVIVDRAAAPASFFDTFPRWRQLISINKRAVGRNDSLDFLLRHDWNSLLSEPSHSAPPGAPGGASRAPTRCPPGHNATASCFASTYSSTAAVLTRDAVDGHLLFGAHSSEYYPHADDLVAYMRGWAAGALAPRSGGAGCAATAADGAQRACDADGGGGAARDAPLRLRLNTTVVRVARAGPGLAATHAGARFELTTSAGGRLACAVLVVATGLQAVPPPLGVNAREAIAAGWLRPYANASVRVADYADKRVLILGRGNAGFEFAHAVMGVAAYVHVLGRAAGRVRLAHETHYPGDVRLVHAQLLESYNLKSLDGLAEVPFEHLRFEVGGAPGAVAVTDVHAPCACDEHGRPDARCFFRREYDVVLSAPGWAFDAALFDADVRPPLAPNGKHPATTAAYESPAVRGLYFAGAAAHARDARKSSGGFIHGFRHTARALHRHLEEAEEQAAGAAAAGGAGAGGASGWPRRRVRGVRALTAALLRRANDAAGPYQLFGGLADVAVLAPPVAAAVRGFAGVGVLAALHDPASFPEAEAEAEVDAATAAPARRRARGTPARASDAAVDAALVADLFEEVPVGLVADKARGAWHAQACGAGAGAGTDAADPEYVTLTLEFGPPPPPPPPGAPADAALRAVTDWRRDPFSRLRANVGLHNPHESQFLHPVLRYFVGGGRPVAETHVIEDFHGAWDLHTPHVLPVARFLQEVGARRAAAAAAAGGAAAPPGGAYAAALRAAWPGLAPDAPASSSPALLSAPAAAPASTHANVLDHLLRAPWATLLYRGAAVRGKEGWALQLSVQAERELLVDGPRFFAAHFLDPDPSPVAPEEARWTAAARRRAALPPGAALLAPQEADAAPVPPPPLPPDRAALRDGVAPFLEALYANLTRALPGLPVVVVRYRAGPSRLLAEEFGAARPDAPGGGAVVRVFDARPGSGGVTNVDGADLAAAPARIAALWRRDGGGGGDGA